jgi:predicted transcriptional regulator
MNSGEVVEARSRGRSNATAIVSCAASEIDFRHAKIAEQVVTEVVVKGLIERDADGALALTDRGRAVLRAMLPDL